VKRKLKKKRKRLQPIVDDYEFSFVALAEEEVSHGSGLAILDDLKPAKYIYIFNTSNLFYQYLFLCIYQFVMHSKLGNVCQAPSTLIGTCISL
jgi:hypothetical protein